MRDVFMRHKIAPRGEIKGIGWSKKWGDTCARFLEKLKRTNQKTRRMIHRESEDNQEKEEMAWRVSICPRGFYKRCQDICNP